MSKYIDESIAFYEEILEVNLMDNYVLDYKVLDDIDFFNECKKETGNIDLSDFLVISVPRENNFYTLLINDYVENKKDNYGLEILYSQLSTIYLDTNYDVNEIIRKCKYPFLNRAIIGVEYWKEYYSIYLCQFVMRQKYLDKVDDTENPYSYEKSLKIGLNFLNKALTSPNKSIDQRLSLMFYSFAKITMACNDKKIYDLKSIIKNKEIASYVQELFSMFSSKGFTELTILHFFRIRSIVFKIIKLLEREEIKDED